jgi:hypothetical protein
VHEVSLGQLIEDYLSGESVPETTYEEFRQALARVLVEDRGYPRDRLRAKVGVTFPIDGREYCRVADLVAYGDDGRPLLVVVFCPGEVESFHRESLAMARLVAGGPAPLAVATDLKDAILVGSATGALLGEGGMASLPAWEELLRLAAEAAPVPLAPLAGERLLREQRILYTYSEFLTGCCGECAPPGRFVGPGTAAKG